MSDYGFLSGKPPKDSDYKALYFTLLSAVQRAGRILDEAQRDCEARLASRPPRAADETDRT